LPKTRILPWTRSLAEKFSLFTKHWSPKIIAELNGQHVKLVKFQGPFVWHAHEHEDELFLVVRGAFTMEYRDRTVELQAGDLIVVPRGVEHRPVADARGRGAALRTGRDREHRQRGRRQDRGAADWI
jgi:mannose-6-phosphate isomerase-like protein (cupin superfamily)